MNMERPVVFNALRQIDSISYLTLTGGEPSLAPQVLDDIKWMLIRNSIAVDFFYVVINGKWHRRRKEFVEHLDWLHEWCEHKEECCLTVSQDQYHKMVLNDPDFRGLEYIEDEYGGIEREYFRPDDRNRYIHKTINEGYAAKTGYGTEDPEQQRPWEVRKYDDEIQVMEDVVYISANGDVTSNCNMSYHRIAKEKKGNVLTDNLEDIILSYCEVEKELEAA
jgi:hypothetical protein